MPASRSLLTRSERREKAALMYAKGYGPTDVARRLGVVKNTAIAYKQWYDAEVSEEVKRRPDMLSDVLGNTVKVLSEIDLVKKDAWKRLNARHAHVCDDCGAAVDCANAMPVQSATQLHATILKAQEQRMKLFGLLGTKHDFYVHVQNIQVLQKKILEFLQAELCESDRMKLAEFLEREMQNLAPNTPLPPMLELEGEEVQAG